MRTQRISVTLVAIAAVSLVLSGCTGGVGPTGYSENSSNSRSDAAAEPEGAGDAASTVTGFGADLATTEFATSWLGAVDIAKSRFDGGVTEVELDWNRSRYTYKVELLSDTEDFEIYVDADTSETSGESTDALDADDLAEAQTKVIDMSKIVTLEVALSSALSAQAGTVDEWTLEGKVEGPQFEFDIVDDSGRDFDVYVDALTGAVLRVED